MNVHGIASRVSEAALAFAVALLLAGSVLAQQMTPQSTQASRWKDVEAVFGYPGSALPDGVVRFNMPRTDLRVTVLGPVFNFQPTGNGRAAIAGDFAMLGPEVGPVMAVLQSNGVQTVALHSHA